MSTSLPERRNNGLDAEIVEIGLSLMARAGLASAIEHFRMHSIPFPVWSRILSAPPDQHRRPADPS